MGTASWAASPASEGSAILLDNGEVLRGRVERLPGKFRIRSANGSSITLDRARVRHVDASLVGLYEFQRDRLPQATPEDHVRLASWCLEQKMFAESERHLHIALQAVPLPRGVQQLQRRLSNLRQPSQSVTETQPAQASATSRSPSPGAVSPLAASDDPLWQEEPRDEELLRSFGTQLQPHLLRNCATAFCHGYGAINRFALVRPVADRPVEGTLTAQNLRSVIAQITVSHDGAERFLRYSTSAHGTLSRSPLAGSDAAERRLDEFVRRVQRSPLAPGRVATASAAVASPQFDPFDPAEFHRRQESAQVSQLPPDPIRPE
jgi:hypothetical protein